MMKLKITPITTTLLLLLMLAFHSCHRQELEYEYTEKAVIPIHVDWSLSQLNPQNVTLLIYDKATKELVLEHFFANNDNPVQSKIELPVGHYTVLTINELRNQIDYVRIEGHTNLSTLHAYIVEKDNAVARQKNDYYLNVPGVLAASVVEDLEVTEKMVVDYNNYKKITDKDAVPSYSIHRYSTDALMHITPRRKVGKCEVVMHVKNLKSSRFPVLVDVRNVAQKYNFEKDLNSPIPSTSQLQLQHHVFDPEEVRDGIVTGETYNFGVMNNRLDFFDQPADYPLNVLAHFMLVDEEKTVKSFDITLTDKQVTFIEEEDTSVTVRIEITLSEALPKVEPAGSKGESGFKISLDEWDAVNVPLKY